MVWKWPFCHNGNSRRTLRLKQGRQKYLDYTVSWSPCDSHESAITRLSKGEARYGSGGLAVMISLLFLGLDGSKEFSRKALAGVGMILLIVGKCYHAS